MRDVTMAGLPFSSPDSSSFVDKAPSKGSALSTSSMTSGLKYSPAPGSSFLNYSTGGYSYQRSSLAKSPSIGRKNGSSTGYGLSAYSVNLHADSSSNLSSMQSNAVSYNDWYKTRTSDSLTDLRQGTTSPDLLLRDNLKSSSLAASNDSINQDFSNMRVSPKTSTENLNSSKAMNAWTSDSTGYTNRPYSPSWTSHTSTVPKTFTGLRSATPSPVHDLGRSFTRSLSSPVDFPYSSMSSNPTSYSTSNYDYTSSLSNNKPWDSLPGRPASPDIVITADEKSQKNPSMSDSKSSLYRSKSEKDTCTLKTISPRSEALKSTTKLRKYLKNNEMHSLDLKEPSIDFEIQNSPVASLIAETTNLSRSRSMSPTPLKAFSFQSMFVTSEATDNSEVNKSINTAQHTYISPYINQNISNLSTPETNYTESKKPSSEPPNTWKQRKSGVTPVYGDKLASELKKSGSVPSNLDMYSNYIIEQRSAFDEIPSMELLESPRGRSSSIGLQSKPNTTQHIPSFEEYKQMRKLSELKIKLASPRPPSNKHKKKDITSPEVVNSELDDEVSKAFNKPKDSRPTDVNSTVKVTRRKSKEGSKSFREKSKSEEGQNNKLDEKDKLNKKSKVEEKDKLNEKNKSDERQSRESSRNSLQPREKRSSSKSRLQRSDPVERCRAKSPFLTWKTSQEQKDNEKGTREKKNSLEERKTEEKKTGERKTEERKTEEKKTEETKTGEKKEQKRRKSQEESREETELKKTERRHRRPSSDKRKQTKEEVGLARSCSDSKAIDVKKHKQRKQRSVEDVTNLRERPHPTRHSSDREVRRKHSQGKSPRSDVSEGSLPSSGRVTPSLHVTTSFEALNETTFEQGDVTRRGRKVRHRASTLSTDSGVGGAQDLEEPDKLQPSSTDIERADSGVGAETNGRRVLSHSDSTASTTSCYDCSNFFDQKQQIIQHGTEYLCEKCNGKRTTRKEAITEFIQTEVNYLEDIKVMHKEFYVAMENAGLLTPEQLKTVFINLQELIQVSETFSDCLQDCADNAADQDDDDYINIHIGKIFLENTTILFPAFEAYCVNQPTGAALLKSLESEKQLLRVFLEVSQNDNRAVRRQHLKSFLMVPVQRSMRYPLLIDRICKTTPAWHEDKERLREAKRRTEDFLEEVNVQSQGTSGTKPIVKRHGSFSTSIPSNLKAEIRKVAVDSVAWNLETVHLVHMTQLLMGPGLEQIWQKMISTPRHVPVYAVLVCTGKVERLSEIETNRPKNGMLFPHADGGRKAALVLIKEKAAGKCGVVREPLLLERCIVSCEEGSDEFTMTEMEGDTIDLKCENSEDCVRWLMLLKHYSVPLGSWRRRRNALANIMINHTLKS